MKRAVVVLSVLVSLLFVGETAEAFTPYQPPPEEIKPAPGPYRTTQNLVWSNGAVIPAGAVILYAGGVWISLSDWAVAHLDVIPLLWLNDPTQ